MKCRPQHATTGCRKRYPLLRKRLSKRTAQPLLHHLRHYHRFPPLSFPPVAKTRPRPRTSNNNLNNNKPCIPHISLLVFSPSRDCDPYFTFSRCNIKRNPIVGTFLFSAFFFSHKLFFPLSFWLNLFPSLRYSCAIEKLRRFTFFSSHNIIIYIAAFKIKLSEKNNNNKEMKKKTV